MSTRVRTGKNATDREIPTTASKSFPKLADAPNILSRLCMPESTLFRHFFPRLGRVIVIAACAMLCGGCDSVESDDDQLGDPAAVQIITADMGRFWKAYEMATSTTDEAEQIAAFQTEYVDKATPGLRDFISKRIGSATNLRKGVIDRINYYSAIRTTQNAIMNGAMEAGIRSSFHELERIYPDAVFADVYLLVGRLSTGGTISENGLLIGTELFSASADTPLDELQEWERNVVEPVEMLPSIVAHEAVHLQQHEATHTLLERAMQEGAADFIGELMSGRNFNEHLHVFGDANEAELWGEFSFLMHRPDLSRWLYNIGNAPDGRPGDLGYYVGYRICEAYYEQSLDKGGALIDIIEMRDPEAILTASGYGAQFDQSEIAAARMSERASNNESGQDQNGGGK